MIPVRSVEGLSSIIFQYLAGITDHVILLS
ncbi:hypothetical protein SAMN05443574_12138 [Haloarcula vallismortis]|uniref:Uncharacterized protein n=1 Tax=Haloarcula vallismortis TaxID=28442 RepID=A0A1H3A4R3_HALVA|nr:hypothetical protein SAMN05443574_12138 [Haloarcula vallismortis]